MRWLPLKTTLLMMLVPAVLTAATAPRWQAIAQHGDVPPPLWEAGISFSLASGEQDTVYRFGGENDEGLVDDFYALDLKTFTWKNLGSPQTPAARANAQLIPGPCVNCVSLVGGRGDFRTGVMFPEMQTYRVKTGRWVRASRAELGERFAVKRAAALIVEVPDARHPRTKKTIYAFGGVGNTVPGFPTTPTGLHNDIAIYDPNTGPDTGWHVVKTSGVKPAPRAWMAGGYDPVTHSLLVFGGYRLGPDQGPDTPGSELFGPTNFANDLWSLDLDTFTWTELHPQGPIPSPRDNAAAFFDTAHGWLVAFGGQHFDSVTNDLWVYSVAENRWTEVGFAPGDPVPPGRVGAVSFLRETPDAYALSPQRKGLRERRRRAPQRSVEADLAEGLRDWSAGQATAPPARLPPPTSPPASSFEEGRILSREDAGSSLATIDVVQSRGLRSSGNDAISKGESAMRSKPVSTLLFVLLLIGFSTTLLASGFPENCAGTYPEPGRQRRQEHLDFWKRRLVPRYELDPESLQLQQPARGVGERWLRGRQGRVPRLLVRRQRRAAQHRPRGYRRSYGGPWVREHRRVVLAALLRGRRGSAQS